MSKARIPAKPAHTLEELVLRFGSEEGLIEAFIFHQLAQDDYHVISPTWLTCCLLRRVLSKLEEVRGAVRGEPPFDAFPSDEAFRAVKARLAASRLAPQRRRKTSTRKSPRQQRRGSR